MHSSKCILERNLGHLVVVAIQVVYYEQRICNQHEEDYVYGEGVDARRPAVPSQVIAVDHASNYENSKRLSDEPDERIPEEQSLKLLGEIVNSSQALEGA